MSVASTDLDHVLAALDPKPSGTYVFTLVDEIPQGVEFFAAIRDEDQYTLVVEEETAKAAGLPADELYTRIDLGSSTELAAIGITASIAQIMSARSITANFMACRRHDHLFVQPDRAQEAAALLADLGRRAKGWLPEV